MATPSAHPNPSPATAGVCARHQFHQLQRPGKARDVNFRADPAPAHLHTGKLECAQDAGKGREGKGGGGGVGSDWYLVVSKTSYLLFI
ncbi:uncharacterized [Tachysurus ichikawai]